MECFWANIIDGSPVLKEHESLRWLGIDNIDDVDWLPANRSIIEKIKLAICKSRSGEE